MDVEQGFQLGEFRHLARRRFWLFGGVAGLVLLAAIFVAAVMPNWYTASATLLIEPQTISRRLVEAGLEESDINSRLHLMTAELLSRGRLSRIIDDLELYADESEEMTREEVIELFRSHVSLEPIIPEMTEELRPRNKEIEVTTFMVFYRNRKPKVAAQVANRLANDFIEKHIKERVRVSGDTTEFIDAERERLVARIAEVEEQIATVKAENVGRLPEQADNNQRSLERSYENLRVALQTLSIAQSDEAFYRQMSTITDGPASQPVSHLESLESQLQGLRARGFTDKHPDVTALLAEIEPLRQNAGDDLAGEEAAGGPRRSTEQMGAQMEAERAGMRVQGTREEVERLQDRIRLYERLIAETPRVAEQLQALEREYSHLFETFQDMSAKSQEAAVAADMERRQKGEQFRILESAYAPLEPSSPNRPLIVALGLVLGLALGAGSAVLVEATDSSFHVSRSMQQKLRIPVLATIPGISLEVDRKSARRRFLRNAFAVSVVVFLVLSGSFAGNWYVNGTPGIVRLLMGDEQQGESGTAPAPGAARRAPAAAQGN